MGRWKRYRFSPRDRPNSRPSRPKIVIAAYLIMRLDSAHAVRMENPLSVMSWLLEGDPAIRWQVMRDLGNERPEVVAAERARVALEGWGARLLALQTKDGHWDGDDRTMMLTIHSLSLLRQFGPDPTAKEVRAALDLVRGRLTWKPLDGRPFFDGETEPCLNGAILAVGAYFGESTDRLVDRLLGEQLEDGGWNCNAPESKRSSFNTTICVLEGLREYEAAYGANPAVTRSSRRGQEYLLERRMYKSLTSGEVINRVWMRFAFPTTWHYDILRGLDYLRSAGVSPDERVNEAVDIVEKRAHQNGRWPLNLLHDDRVPFDMEPGVGKASRWNTLRALRVLKWAGKVASQQ